MKDNYLGSDWLKCDLHIHTPASFFQRYGDRNDPKTWDQFLDDLEALPPEFKVIGINDYLTIEGYKRVVSEKAKGRLQNIECILPVIEFRLNRFAGESKTRRLNYHVIFSDKIDPSIIETQFIAGLNVGYSLEAGGTVSTWSSIPNEQSLEDLGRQIQAQAPTNETLAAKTALEVGFDNFNVDYAQLKKLLDTPHFRGRVITALGKNEWEDYRWDAGGAGDKRTIINEADLTFTASASVENHQKGKESLKNQNVKHLLLDCSDAHYPSSSAEKDKIGNCFTWLKIEPTFEGLKQILFEPETRIAISETNPDKKPPYQVIDYVRFVNGGTTFTNKKIYLSPYLNSVIGGKSTGKSLLAGLIVKASDPSEFKKKVGVKAGSKTEPLSWISEREPTVNFEVVWKDGLTTSLQGLIESRKVTYFPQHYLNSNINDHGAGNKELNKIIRVVLAQNQNYEKAFTQYAKESQELDAEIGGLTISLENVLRDLRHSQYQAKERGKSADVQSNLARLQGEFSAQQGEFNLTEDELASHAALTAELKGLKSQKAVVSQNVENLTRLSKQGVKDKLQARFLFPEVVVGLSQDVETQVSSSLRSLSNDFGDKVADLFESTANAEKLKLKAFEDRELAVTQLLKPILEKIEKSAPLRELSAVIEAEKKKLSEVQVLEQNIAANKERLAAFQKDLKGLIDKRLLIAGKVTDIAEKFPISKGDDQLDIEITPHVKMQHIRDILKDRIKYQSNSEVKAFIQGDEAADRSFATYKDWITTVIDQAASEKLELKGDYTLSAVLQGLMTNATYLNYDLKLGGDSFSVMSPGKRALALLRIIIELDSSQHPIILDQPEDDLDNRSIFEGLANYIKAKKIDRQIVVVTHNPNVVVGADSEYVIVANQSGQESNRDNENFDFEYVYGGLENSFEDSSIQWVLDRQGVKEHVCEILDGGKTAFERREKLYSTFKEQV